MAKRWLATLRSAAALTLLVRSSNSSDRAAKATHLQRVLKVATLDRLLDAESRHRARSDNRSLHIGRPPLFAAQPINQRLQIADGVGEMFGPPAVDRRMLAFQVVEHRLEASEPGKVEISLSRHAGEIARTLPHSLIAQAYLPPGSQNFLTAQVLAAMLAGVAGTILIRVRRRCLVCDFEDEREEVHTSDEIGPECLRCHAPTERIAVLGRRTVKSQPNPHAAALGRLGGLKGGPARARALSATRRREIARLGARVRWAKRR